MLAFEPSTRDAHPEFTRRRRALGYSVERLSLLVGIPAPRLRYIEFGLGRAATLREIHRIDHALSVIEAAHTRLRLELETELQRAGDLTDAPSGRGGGAA